ncbi:hypothetical protein [Altererythrobacter lauratis]|uniref:Cytochrome c n=1 Tax=Alteraurantiacibacter lauratis TaxID=2054627 RepID=A0ABV7EGQ1_9SPHN
MRPAKAILTLALCSVGLAALAAPAATQGTEPLYVRHEMQAEINPAVVAIWDVGNTATDDYGMLDASKMTQAQWNTLADAAAALVASSERMARAGDIRAAAPGNMATEEYEVTMAQVQDYIDADPATFRVRAAEFALVARNLETAARARDAAVAGEIVANLDAECAVCHAQFWYPEAP